ncbi:MAG TPA: hypothetical protein VEU73_13870 [Gemmatimonadales bacterium]|nr:hypothetical protein [Gemmatimonadales bacterium]
MTVRAFLRAVSQSEWSVEFAAARLRVTRRRAGHVINQLVELGYVEAASTKGDRSYKRSLAGSTLAQASAAQPLRRGTAARKLADFLARVRRINEDDYYLYRVKKVLVFGSYLTAAARINDIDVAIELVHRWEDPDKHSTLRDARIHDATRNGRRFGNISEEVSWPETEVLLELKARSRAISLHPTDDAILNRADCKTVFEDVESLST